MRGRLIMVLVLVVVVTTTNVGHYRNAAAAEAAHCRPNNTDDLTVWQQGIMINNNQHELGENKKSRGSSHPSRNT